MSHKPWLERCENESGTEHQHSSPLLQTMGQAAALTKSVVPLLKLPCFALAKGYNNEAELEQHGLCSHVDLGS